MKALLFAAFTLAVISFTYHEPKSFEQRAAELIRYGHELEEEADTLKAAFQKAIDSDNEFFKWYAVESKRLEREADQRREARKARWFSEFGIEWKE